MLNNIIRSCVLLTVACFISVQAPKLHRSWLRNKVASQVVMITDSATGTHGGTGVHVRTKQGVVILTNDHICQGTAFEGYVNVGIIAGVPSVKRKVLKHSEEADLCIIEGLPGYKGLDLAKDFQIGEVYHMIGHPSLNPITMVDGELVGPQNVTMFDGLIKDPKTQCKLKKNVALGGICFLQLNGFISTLLTFPGNSGSPLVNDRGQIVGLAYLTNQNTDWGSFVSLPDIKNFLSK